MVSKGGTVLLKQYSFSTSYDAHVEARRFPFPRLAQITASDGLNDAFGLCGDGQLVEKRGRRVDVVNVVHGVLPCGSRLDSDDMKPSGEVDSPQNL